VLGLFGLDNTGAAVDACLVGSIITQPQRRHAFSGALLPGNQILFRNSGFPLALLGDSVGFDLFFAASSPVAANSQARYWIFLCWAEPTAGI
jgi:hypothetical protein